MVSGGTLASSNLSAQLRRRSFHAMTYATRRTFLGNFDIWLIREHYQPR